jgi:hypothetical protein
MLLGLTMREYRALEAGEDAMLVAQVWERMVEVFQWPFAPTPRQEKNRQGCVPR